MLRNGLLSGLRNSSGLINNTLPFNVPNISNTASTIANTSSLLGASKFSFTGILDNASKTINTINQIVPLYQQIKPMFSNAKTALNIFKTVKKIDQPPTNNLNKNPNSININNKQDNINSNKIKNDNQNEQIIINKTIPNKPFFV